MIDINVFREWSNYVCAKTNSGNTETLDQFNDNCFRSIMMPYEKDHQTFIDTKKVSDFLRSYLVTDYIRQINPNSPIISYPTDLQHISSVGAYTNGKQVKVEKMENSEWREMLSSGLYPATKRFPKYQQIQNGIEVAPKDIGTVYLDYFRTPLKPLWNYTVVDGDPVYNPATSVGLEISEFAFNNVSAYYFGFRGINLTDANITAFATAFKAESNMKL